MDTIFIRGLSLRGRHGVHEYERVNEQEFIIDIEAVFDTRQAATTDALEETVNYSSFAHMAKEVVEGNSFYLIERLAEKIAECVLEDPRISEAHVTIRKPQAAKYGGVPGVSIVRSRI